jgi:preprotein translocase subunit SecY
LIRSYGLIDAGDLSAIWVGIVIVLSFTAGSAFLMWLGEQITEFGVGNGISIILFAGIVSRFPRMVSDCISGLNIWNGVRNGTVTEESLTNAGMTTVQAQAQLKLALPPWMIPVIIIGMLALVVFIVFISNAERRIPVQYAKRVVGRKMYGGQSTHIPLKVNMSGVMPIIFAQSIASLPATIGAFAGWTTDNSAMMRLFDTSKPFYSIIYFLLIVGFSYFYASMTFNPIEVANNLKKNGGFIPGFRPGKPTADFITKVLNKITMFGALYLSVVAIAPIVTGNIVGYSSLAIGGTSVIIVVGVALETVKQIEAQMLMRHYKGFLE